MAYTSRGDVLVIDRDAQAREQLARQLQAEGFDVLAFDRASDAVDRFVAHRAALILYAMDTEPPSALAALARIRELPGGHEVLIEALTRASGAELARVRSFGAMLGITGFLGHPPDPADLHLHLAALGHSAAPASPAPEGDGRQTLRTLREAHLRISRQSHHERLGLPPDAGASAARAAYRSAIHAFRPDAIAEHGQEVRRLLRDIFEALGQSYRALSDPTLRAERRAALPETPPEPVAAPRPPLPPPDVVPPSRSAPSWSWPVVDGPGPAVAKAELPPEPAPPEPPPPEPQRPEAAQPEPPPERLPREPAHPHPLSEPAHQASGPLLESAEELSAAARLLTILGEYDGAADLLGQALTLDPGDSALRYEVALCLARKHRKHGDAAKARTHFVEACRLAPEGEVEADEELAALDSPGSRAGGRSLRSRVLRTNIGKH